jgi:ABC-type sugar transport system substrate-binding protein
VGTTGELAAARTAMVQYLIGHPETKAILALGLEPLIEALPALKEAKMDLPVAGFDLSPEVLDGIKDGKIIATVDQQPYSQGFYAVTELALEIKYGIYPNDMNTGGNGLVDKTNYEPAVKFAGTYR